ncbi:MAG: porin [Comamonas sp.]|nr:porin [Candidatus Comamonas equi]
MLNFQRAAWAALALGCAPAAWAASDVQLYGRINTSIEFQKWGSHSASGVLNNGSFLGLRGQEDLGQGLKAGFVLESALLSDDGRGDSAKGGLDFERRSELHLRGDFGMLRLGTFDNYSYTVTGEAIAWHNDDAGITQDSFLVGNARRTNSVAYRTPTWAGWHAELGYQLGEKYAPYGLRGNNAWDVGVNYAHGPWGLGLGLQRHKSVDIDYGDHFTNQNATMRVSYSTDSWSLGAYYQSAEEKGHVVGIGPTVRRWDSVRLAAMYRWNASALHLNVGHNDFRMNDWDNAGGSWVPMSLGSDRVQWTLAYHYHLSPRSKAYVFYTHQDDSPHWNAMPALMASKGGDFRSFGLGMRHLF